MKAAIISTYNKGGAGIAAHRLHRALQQANIESDMFTKSALKENPEVCNPLAENYIIPWFHTTVKPGNTMSSLPYPSTGLNFLNNFSSYDIINLHWITHFIPLEAIYTVDKPIVWTLHDQNTFTGGCHYTHGCTGYEKDCSNCPQIINDYAKRVLAVKHSHLPENIVLVTPSKWMGDCARQSSLFKNNRIEVIPNSIDTEVFKQYEKTEARAKLGLPQDNKVIMLSAMDLTERRKGLHHFIEAFRKITKHEEIKILTCGAGDIIPGLESFCKPMGIVEDENLLAMMYSAADVFVLPSEEDNLPNVMLESLSCGTPVVAFRTGGMAETIIEGETGELAEPFDAGMLAEKIDKALENNASMRQRCREYALDNFSFNVQAARYKALFEDVIKSYSGLEEGKTAPPICPELVQLFGEGMCSAVENNRNELEKMYEHIREVNLNALDANWRVQYDEVLAANNELTNSFSWKITKPLRAVSRLMKREQEI